MDRLTFLQFMLLALALPAQYLISEYWSYDAVQRSQALKGVIDGVYNIKDNYFSIEAWKDWYLKLVIDKPPSFTTMKRKKTTKNKKINTEEEESVALEVLNYRKNLETFAESTQIRTVHDSRVKYRVGQVVKHKRYGMHGVIIGWDVKASATEEWIARNYNQDERERLLEQPHYLILVDSQYTEQFQGKSYVAEEHVELLFNTRVNNKLLSAYFDVFDGGQYNLKEFLRIVYPQD